MESSSPLLSAIPYFDRKTMYIISGGLFFLYKYTIKNQKDNPYVSGFSLYPQQPVSHKAMSIRVMNRMGFIIRMFFSANIELKSKKSILYTNCFTSEIPLPLCAHHFLVNFLERICLRSPKIHLYKSQKYFVR